jgi:ribonuclease HI
LEQELKDTANIKIYMNGSCQNGTVGASAILYYTQKGSTVGNPAQILCCTLGLDTKYLVWKAEAASIMMAFWLLRGLNRISCLPISIYSDSQAVLKAIRVQRASPGYQLIKEITSMVEALIQVVDPPLRQHRIRLCWIVAHRDVKRNKKADEEAKKAASRVATSSEHLPHSLRSSLPLSIGVTKHQYLLKLWEEWVDIWSLSPRKTRMEKMDKDFPYEKHCNSLDNLTRIQSSLLF